MKLLYYNKREEFQMETKHLFNDILSSVLDERKITYKSLRTVAWEQTIAKRIFCYFQNTYIEELSEKELNSFFQFIRFKENGELYSDKYLKAINSIVKATFKKAMLRGYININPFDYDLKRPKGKPTIAKQRIIEKNELNIVLRNCKENKRLKYVVPILLMTGLRIGELLGLYWTDIDFNNNIIKIEREVSDNFVELPTGEIVKRGVRIDTPKTNTSIRELPVTQQVIDLFREMLIYRDLPENARWKKSIVKNNNLHLCFPNGAGKLTDYRTLYDTLIDFLKENHLQSSRITFHKFRHNYATDLLEAGVDVAVISQMLGHSSIETTVNTYISDTNLNLKVNAVKKQTKFISRNYQ